MHASLLSRIHFRRGWLAGFWVVCGLSLALSAASAYVLDGIRWPDNKSIELDLQLGSPQGTLIDGTTSWNNVAKTAADIWNPYLGSGVRLVTRETNFAPAQLDGRNSVFFNSSVFGEDFGDDTLATTVSFRNRSTGFATESDVVFNVAQSFNSYRGPLRTNGGTPVYDLRRVMLHELGHVLGLDHVPQATAAIMAPDITDIDTLQADDIAGVKFIYGDLPPVPPVFHDGLNASGLIGQKFSYQLFATNMPVIYQAIGLPAGLSLNAAIGFISGFPSAAGTYDVEVSATNGAGTGTATLHLVFADKLTITGDLKSKAYVGRPYYYQIPTNGQATSFTAYNDSIPPGLSLDAATGLISGSPTTAGIFRLALEARNAVSSDFEVFDLTIANDATLSAVNNTMYVTALFKGGDGNLYGATSHGGDDDSAGGILFKLTPAGELSPFYRFDYRGSSPYLPDDLHEAADGSFYGTTTHGGAHIVGTVFKVTKDGKTMTTLASFPATPSNNYAGASVLLASDGNYYASVRPFVGAAANPGGSVYKITPTGVLTTLHTFNGTDGFCPSALIQAADGDFYGTTYRGGRNNLGTVFKIAPTGTLTTLHSFASPDGSLPLAPLVQARDGNFYGTTYAGGKGKGTMFKMTPAGGLTTIHSIAEGEGNCVAAPLVEGSDGNFYGTAGSRYLGVENTGGDSFLFKLTPEGTLTNLHKFASYEGVPSSLPLVSDGAGNFYSSGDKIYKETPSAVPLVYAPPVIVPPVVELPGVTLEATIPQVAVGSGGAAQFVVRLSAIQDHNVTIRYKIKGSAINGTDYVQLTGTKKIKAGKLSKPIKVIPQGDLGGVALKTVVLKLVPDDAYTVDTIRKVKARIVSGQ